MFYDTSLDISYNNDDQYRDCLVKILGISESVSGDTIELGNTTELLSKIYKATSKDPRFAQLYRRAAALLFSEDPTDGLTIMFSYSCLAKFHAFLSIFFSKEAALVTAITTTIKEEAHDGQEEECDEGADRLFADLNKILDEL
jgi:hypothetical protein